MRALFEAVFGVRGELGAFVATRGRTWERLVLDEPILSVRVRPLAANSTLGQDNCIRERLIHRQG